MSDNELNQDQDQDQDQKIKNPFQFELDDDEITRFKAWRDEQEEKVSKMSRGYGACGGGYTFSFTPTGIGLSVTVKNTVTKEEIDLTDYDSW